MTISLRRSLIGCRQCSSSLPVGHTTKPDFLGEKKQAKGLFLQG
jgi:hypothetical protein